jgi:1-deoxy-D-xylulose-5-phosphate reductoisomerase
VVIHPQSVIHSMVSYADGSVLAQLGNPDMRTPIAHALAYPERIESGVDPVDLARIAQLNFRQPDYVRFPCLKLAFNALEAGGSAAAVLNAANEIAVEAFLDRKIGFRKIPQIIEQVLNRLPDAPVNDLDSLLAQDQRARAQARELLV